MSVTPAYIVNESNMIGTDIPTASTTSTAQQVDSLREDGMEFKKKYYADIQSIINRVQHHMHKKTKNGYVPLKSCARKVKNHCAKCKADFPKTQLCIKTSSLVCRGIARKLKLAIAGRRNSFGQMIGRRSCEWQSGTIPSFAAGFRSNTHSLPNWRLPALPETHNDKLCKSKKCAAHVTSGKDIKVMAKLAQRVQRQCTGYYCGYTFKAQPIGRKFLRLVGESLSYLEPTLSEKTAGQRWHRVTHRILTDFQHRCMRRTAAEEWNLATNYHDQDVTNAEFFISYTLIEFNGKQLVRRLQMEQKANTNQKANEPLRCRSLYR